ncbi:hypothetical protein P171DRAFT_462849 [Karstenula rhodostoma CBS 690.94]|uniref:BZIP domain-containing protein n=1 Tax=Karstenula rhodostoma CBS 690.94 TaxID=1392251 RepID=A0A9P4UEN7_9PLEO|nr:hypothetical protein P171DRAFT_462849 [Karstenula rhodostoma CBS 690.94]
MVKFTFKPFKPFKGQKEASDSASAEEPRNPHQKRREQVRKAQKSHRERKEAYVKSLETEVVQLRANEGKLFQETKKLYAEINVMRALLVRNGIPIPSGLPLSPRDHEKGVEEGWGRDVETGGREGEGGGVFEFSVAEKMTTQSHERIVVRRQTRKRSNGWSNTAPGSDHSRTRSTPSPPGVLTPPVPLPTTFDTILSSSPSPLVSTQDPTAVGMDFILSLEAPCLGHIPHAPSTSTASPSGHALMASATLLHLHLHQDHDHPPASHSRPSTWTVPESGVQRLLELARNIPLDGEVTPVQAWAYIRQHAQFGRLRVERVEEMKKGLLGWVKCYGFGGVVPLDAFEGVVGVGFEGVERER